MIRLIALALFLLPSAALAQARGSHCIAIVQNWDGPAQLIQAQASAMPMGWEEVTIDYVGHSTFLITTPEGYTIATDYAGFAGPGVIPDVVTMNQAHSSHWTPFPDTRIPHVLRGWESVVATTQRSMAWSWAKRSSATSPPIFAAVRVGASPMATPSS